MIFTDVHEIHRAYETGCVELQVKVRVRIKEYVRDEQIGDFKEKIRLLEITVGRALLSEVLPKGLPFELVNRTMTKKAISNVINVCYRDVGLKSTVIFADQLMYTGFHYATRSGVSIGVNDLVIPKEKTNIISQAEEEVEKIQAQFSSGLVTQGERYNKVVDIWSRTNDQVAKVMMSELSTEIVKDAKGQKVQQESFNSIYMMADSGARGSVVQMCELS